MKKQTFLILFLLSYFAKAQAPQGFSYQAAVRNASGTPLVNIPVKVRFSILDSSANGPAVYKETHSTTTNAGGLFNVNVGLGTAITGTLAGVNWGTNAKFLQVDIDTTQTGNNYINIGVQQLMSVPYALYAGNSNNNSNIGYYKKPTMLSTISSSTMNASSASTYCSQLSQSGFDDWRLPTLAEYEYLRDDVSLTTNNINCWTKDFTTVGQEIFNNWVAVSFYVTTYRDIVLYTSLLSTVCIR